MKVALHVVKARRARLAALLREHQYLPVQEVCARLGVSEATARRDLAALAEEHAITRTRGGALYEYNQRFPSFRERQAVQGAGKERIARAAARLVAPGSVIWLDGGTTCHAIAGALARAQTGGLTVVTNNLPAAELLADQADLAVHLLGGQVFLRSGLLVPRSPEALRAWSFDEAFLGAEGLTAEGAWNSLADVVAVQRAVAARARRAIYCADASKLGKQAPAFLAPLTEIEHLLTDADAAQLRRHRIRLGARRLIAA